MSAGIVLGWTSPAITSLKEVYKPNSTLTEEEVSWVASLAPLGALLGALPAGRLADYWGRKSVLLAMTGPFLLGWVLILMHQSMVVLLYVARFTSGVAVGAVTVVISLYNCEVAEDRVRGTVGAYLQLMITVGILWAYVLGAFLDYYWLSLVSCAVPVIFFFSFLFMPESSLFLITRGRDEDAERSLKWLRGDHDVRPEMDRLRELLSRSSSGSVGKMSWRGPTGRAVVITIGLMAFQQLSGINAVIFYSERIFEDAGSTLSPSLSTIIVGVVQVLATYASSVLVDRTGRRVLLLLSDTAMAVCLLVLSVYFFIRERHPDHVTFIAWLPLASVVVYIVLFSLGFGPLPWFMIAEIVPAEVKGVVSAVAVCVNWALVFVVTKAFGPMVEQLGAPVTFILFCAVCSTGTAFVALFVPETKGKSLSEIQSWLERRPRQDIGKI
uniref:Major facilitator superfamily (MFS) profile domain-containing protein n=1 Tax=Timema tahoe TaxID=61484 RepID=A0A7R9IR36_9NEOP|nr:unnamed protein product [Timema tahoe]